MTDRLAPEELDRLPFIRCPDCGHPIHIDIEAARADEREKAAQRIEAASRELKSDARFAWLAIPVSRVALEFAAKIVREGSDD